MSMNDCDRKIDEMEKEIGRLRSLIEEKDKIIEKNKEYIFVLEYELEKMNSAS
ncbi:hypothetical protein [Methanobrevibacter sp.]|uniref:hypothetical protein n=1 Tax=Methanobrevibacter sp. TaxID=66852 RepID=UPI0025E9CFCB|nr:hypothetical protein [Methanobrevibacter sp.]MBQ2666066.1 hypothetical protein [Methanobrevibacter sp.]